MRSFIRRTTTLALLGALAVGSGLPAAAQSGQVESLTHRQSIKTELSNTGEAGTSRVFTQLQATGSGEVTVTLPQQSTRGLRNLEGFGKPDVNGDDVIWTLDASEEGFARSVADNTAELPVSVSVVYRLDGSEVSPNELAGRTGKVEVEYTVRNLTAEPRDVISFDAENNKFTETMDIAVPMVGSLSLTLPASFANVDAPGGVTVGDGRGNTVINYSLLLFSPLGSEEQTVTWTADSVDTAIPETSVQVLPVDDRSFGSLNATAEAYKGASASLSELANGALIINSNLLLLGSGASQLLDGLNQLSDGADRLNDGLANTAAPGARQLSDGMSAARAGGGQLATGLGELALGATRLSNGLGDARAGGTRLSNGLGDLAAGMTQLQSGTARLAPGLGQLADGAGQLAANTPALAKGAGDLSAGIDTIAKGAAGFEPAADGLEAIAEGLEGVDGGIDRLIEAVAKIRAGVGNVPGCDPDDEDTTCGVLDGLNALENGIALLRGGIATQARPNLSTPECNPLTGSNPADCGAAQLAGAAATVSGSVEAGLEQAQDDLAELRTQLAPVIGSLPTEMAEALEEALDDAAVGLATAEGGAGSAAALAAGARLKALGVDAALADTGLLGGGLVRLAGGVDKLQEGITRVDDGDPNAEDFNPGLQQALTLTLGGLTNPACDPRNPRNPANPCGLKQVVSILLGPGADQLAADLAPALRSLSEAFGTIAKPGALTAGAQAIKAGTAAVDGGIQLLAPGAAEAASGARELNDGAVQLRDGSRTAAAGSRDLVSGLGQLDDGAGQLAAGAGTAASGSRDLASGLVQLDDGALQLANGLGDAADGSGQLAEGLDSAEEGGDKIANGVGALQEGFEERLIGGVSSGRQGASQDYEQVKAVIQRGREGAAPYGIADGADATTVFQFDLAGVGTEEGPSTLLLVVLALVALGAAAGLGLALRQRLTA